MPKVSVIIPSYNHGRYILQAIESVFSQTYDDYEIIVVDDGSTDNTEEAVKPYWERIRYFYKEHGGDASARNFGTRKANGEYLVFLDADDLLMPKKLEIQATILDENPDIGFVYSDFYNIIDNKISHTPALNRKLPSGFIAKELFMESFIPIHTEMVRRQCFKDSGLFDE
jgi:glycosyltransferase involved in cell wall biosynthesis